MKSAIVNLTLTILVIPTIAMIFALLLNSILTAEVITTINNIIDYIDYFIGSKYTNILLSTITIAMITSLCKRIFGLIRGKNED